MLLFPPGSSTGSSHHRRSGRFGHVSRAGGSFSVEHGSNRTVVWGRGLDSIWPVPHICPYREYRPRSLWVGVFSEPETQRVELGRSPFWRHIHPSMSGKPAYCGRSIDVYCVVSPGVVQTPLIDVPTQLGQPKNGTPHTFCSCCLMTFPRAPGTSCLDPWHPPQSHLRNEGTTGALGFMKRPCCWETFFVGSDGA